MSDYEYGPLRTYEITWRTGHVETVQGHSVQITGGPELFARHGQPVRPVRFTIYGMFQRGEHKDWRMVLSGLEDDVLTIRDATTPEQIAEQEHTEGGAS